MLQSRMCEPQDGRAAHHNHFNLAADLGDLRMITPDHSEGIYRATRIATCAAYCTLLGRPIRGASSMSAAAAAATAVATPLNSQ